MSNRLDPASPVGKIAIIGMKGCEEITAKVDRYLLEWRDGKGAGESGSYQYDMCCPRFSSGEAKCNLKQSIRGHDIYIIADLFNYGVRFKMYNESVPMSPDDHYQDLKRIIGAAGGKARRISVIMPMLYEGRQHRRIARESLDCAIALQELAHMGVTNLITFDAHDARVQNAVPLIGFDNFQPAYQMIKALVKNVPDIEINRDQLAIVSPDEGGMSRCIFYSSVLGLDLNMFYKRRDYTRIVGGRNPIVSHEFLGGSIEGKDVIIIDDIISSGDSMLDIAQQIKERKARRVYVFATFGLFCNGLEKFDEAYEKGYIEKVFTTNLVYRPEALKQKKWYTQVDMSKYIAYIIDTLNCDKSMSQVLDPAKKIEKLLKRVNSVRPNGSDQTKGQ